MILKRSLKTLQKGNLEELIDHVDKLSKIGLRTLLLAKRNLTNSEY